MLSLALSVSAQHDSAYYETHNDVFHGRLYLIQKYNTLHYKYTGDENEKNINYFPHTIPGIGVGFTYDWVTVNLSYGFRLNGEERAKGSTKYLDLQIHSYAKKFVIDIFGQSYEGMYIPGKKDVDGNYYHRSDLQSRLFGGSFQYILNNKRFSFRSSFLQTDWQKKSAGSVLLGFEAYAGRIRADSTLLPGGKNAGLNTDIAKEDKFWQVGPTLGYTYTLVIKQHFFITGSFAESLNYGRRILSEDSDQRVESRFVTNPSYRIMAGYNSERWGIAIFYINNRVNVPGSINNYELAVSSGTFRINYVYRFRSQGKIGELIDRI
jgi:hypothetical protein